MTSPSACLTTIALFCFPGRTKSEMTAGLIAVMTGMCLSKAWSKLIHEKTLDMCVFEMWLTLIQGWSRACAAVSLRKGFTSIRERMKSIASVLVPELFKTLSGKLVPEIFQYRRRCSWSENVLRPVKAQNIVSPRHHMSALKGSASFGWSPKGLPIVSGAMKLGVPRMVVVPEEAPLRRLRPRSPSTIHHLSSSVGLRCIEMFFKNLSALYR
jgi:hypothetical protein